MSHVVHPGMALVDDGDVHAIAGYFARSNRSAAKNVGVAKLVQSELAKSRFDPSQTLERGASLYAAACAACHYSPASGPQAARPDLGLKSSLIFIGPGARATNAFVNWSVNESRLRLPTSTATFKLWVIGSLLGGLK